MLALSVLLAVCAAVSNALSSVMQRKANQQEATRTFSAGLLLALVRRPAWLAGAGFMAVSAVLQASALSIGALALVEPLLVFELPLTLILGSVILQHPLRRSDWVTTAVMAAGLALMIVVLNPSGGDAAAASLSSRLGATAVTVAAIGLLTAVAALGPRAARAALFGVAAGAGFGFAASLLKLAVTRLTYDGVLAFLTTWETYGAVGAGIGSVVLVQAALHAGTLVAAQPGLTLLDPVVAVTWGVAVIGEDTRMGWILVLAGVGAVMILLAAVVLARAIQREHLEGG